VANCAADVAAALIARDKRIAALQAEVETLRKALEGTAATT
jgi:hypothetical protein